MMLKSNKAQGILFIILAGFFFSMMTFLVRIAGDLPTMQKVFFRNAVAAVVSFVMLSRTPEKFHIKKTSWPSLLMRSTCGCLGMICNFYSIDKLGLADANILNKLSPFFAIIFSVFVLKEIASKVEWLCVAIAFVGAIFVVKPSFQMTSVYGLVGVLGGLGAGIAYTYVRKLGKMGERGPVIVMFFSFYTTIFTLPFFILNFKPMSAKQWVIMLMAGVMATGGQLSITKAYTKAPAKEISVFDYTQIVFAAMLGMFFLSEIPDVYSIVGYIIIIGVAIFKWWYNLRMDAMLIKSNG